MARIKTAELTSNALDWAVARCEQVPVCDTGADFLSCPDMVGINPTDNSYSPSTNWAQGGPIIEREQVALGYHNDGVRNHAVIVDKLSLNTSYHAFGTTPLIAAMRCYVASKLGDEVDIPDNLTF